MASQTKHECRHRQSHQVKRNKQKYRDNTQSKSDKKDALVIAGEEWLLYLRSFHLRSFEKLRVLMANRDVIVKRLVSSINQINRLADVNFPELRQVFKDVSCKGAIATLRLFPTPAELCSLQPQDIVTGWKSCMKRHWDNYYRNMISLHPNSKE